MVLFRRLIMVEVLFISSSGSKYCFDRGVILFNSRICFCECPVGVNCPWKYLVSANFLNVSIKIYPVRVYIRIYGSLLIYKRPYTLFHVCWFSIPSLPPWVECKIDAVCSYILRLSICASCLVPFAHECVYVCVRVCMGMSVCLCVLVWS